MQKSLFDMLVLVLCVGLYGYLGWHYFYGPRSIAAQEQIEAKQARLQAELAGEIEKRLRLEARVNLLRPEHIDLDFLDEMVRRTLNYVDSRELIMEKEQAFSPR